MNLIPNTHFPAPEEGVIEVQARLKGQDGHWPILGRVNGDKKTDEYQLIHPMHKDVPGTTTDYLKFILHVKKDDNVYIQVNDYQRDVFESQVDFSASFSLSDDALARLLRQQEEGRQQQVSLNQRISELSAEFSHRDNLLTETRSEMEREVSHRDNLLAQERNTVQAMQTEITRLNEQEIASRDATIQDNSIRIAHLESELTALQRLMDDATATHRRTLEEIEQQFNLERAQFISELQRQGNENVESLRRLEDIFTRQANDTDARANALLSEYRGVREEREQLYGQNLQYQNTIRDLQRERNELRQQLDSRVAEEQQMQQRLAEASNYIRDSLQGFIIDRIIKLAIELAIRNHQQPLPEGFITSLHPEKERRLKEVLLQLLTENFNRYDIFNAYDVDEQLILKNQLIESLSANVQELIEITRDHLKLKVERERSIRESNEPLYRRFQETIQAVIQRTRVSEQSSQSGYPRTFFSSPSSSASASNRAEARNGLA